MIPEGNQYSRKVFCGTDYLREENTPRTQTADRVETRTQTADKLGMIEGKELTVYVDPALLKVGG